jgi:hypothetical protein
MRELTRGLDLAQPRRRVTGRCGRVPSILCNRVGFGGRPPRAPARKISGGFFILDTPFGCAAKLISHFLAIGEFHQFRTRKKLTSRASFAAIGKFF